MSGIISNKINYSSDYSKSKKYKVKKIIESSFGTILLDFIIPMMIIIIIFLGALQVKYPHESTIQHDLNYSLGNVGLAFYSIYNVGVENPKWFYYFFIILAGYIYFVSSDIYDNIKRIWSGVDEMTAQDIIDISNNIETDMKGGNKYKNDFINNG